MSWSSRFIFTGLMLFALTGPHVIIQAVALLAATSAVDLRDDAPTGRR